MARVTVTEPATGVEIEVEDTSPQAIAWGTPAKKSASRSTKSDETETDETETDAKSA